METAIALTICLAAIGYCEYWILAHRWPGLGG